MPIILWNESHVLGIDIIDEQHKQLIGHINRLHDALKVGEGKKVTTDVLHGMTEYASLHFKTEEGYMSQCGYAEEDYRGHIAEHDKFREKMSEFKGSFEAGNTAVCLDMMRFFMDWLLNHVQSTDRKYVPYIKKCLNLNK